MKGAEAETDESGDELDETRGLGVTDEEWVTRPNRRRHQARMKILPTVSCFLEATRETKSNEKERLWWCICFWGPRQTNDVEDGIHKKAK